MPSAITSGRKVQLLLHHRHFRTLIFFRLVHDFFQPQPIKDASAFLLRLIIHDWADPSVKKNLRASAVAGTKLVVVDCIVPYSCQAALTKEIPGAALTPVPAPLSIAKSRQGEQYCISV